MIKTRVLIVEDETIVALDIQDRLSELGYQVTGIADRGDAALALTAADRPDLVLMDIQLKGGMDGIATAEAIRKRFRIPVIYLTAFSDGNTLQRAKITEPFGYIIKPFEDREIQSTIEMALYKHGAEERLRQSERRYATTLTSIGDGVIATDAHGGVTFMNPVAENLTGWSLPEAQGRPLDEVFQIVNEESRQTVANPVATVLRQGKVVGLANHTILIGRNGREIPIDDCASPILGDLGQITGTVLVFQNVSERRQKEAELRRIEWMLAPNKGRPPAAGEGAPLQAYGDLTGLNTSRLILDSVGSDLLHDIVTDYLDLLDTSSAVYEKNGDYAFGIFSSGWCRFMDQAARNCCATDDNRKALSSGRWHCHESCWTDASSLAIERGEAVDIACRGGLRLHAVPVFAGVEIVGSINIGYNDPPRDPATLRALAELYEVSFDDLLHLAKTYQTRPPFIIELAKSRLKSSARLIGEIVRRRILERRQQESEQQYRLLFAGNPHPMWVYDLETLAFLAVNEAAIVHYGYSHDEFLAMTIKDIRPPEHIDALLRSVATVTNGLNKSGVWLHRLKDGRIIEMEITSHTLLFGNRRAELVLAYDVSERKQIEAERLEMERRLLHTQKLESLGVLAGGIAHDFNNLLMVILGYADLSLLEVSPVSPVRSKIEEIIKASHRAADLCRQMLAYSGKGNFVIEHMYLNEVIEEMTHMLKTSISKKVLLNLNLEKMVPPIEGDPAQIRQVIMNLVINASEAIGDKSGAVTISTGAKYCDTAYFQETFHADSLSAGQYVSVEVSDTGCGMDKETQSRIFEPFFTTKFTGRGLGMSAVMGIMQGHRGALKVYSEPGKGTTFRLLFPASAEAGAALTEEGPAPDSEWRGSGTVLLVDDEETVLAVGRSMLETLGFSVITAWDGREAVTTYRLRGQEIAFVVMDLTMPHMGGEEAFRELRRIDPSVKVFISSGYSEWEVSARFAGKSLAGFIQKPYQMNELRNVLKGSAAY